MVSQLKPCGTAAAYRRHLRNGEEACDECKAAVAKDKMDKLDGDRESRKVSALAPVPDVVDDVDPLEDARENLRAVKAAMAEAVPREVSALSKRRQELVELIAGLGGKKEVSLGDQLAEVRRRRSGT